VYQVADHARVPRLDPNRSSRREVEIRVIAPRALWLAEQQVGDIGLEPMAAVGGDGLEPPNGLTFRLH
jgi:hypothetical protein